MISTACTHFRLLIALMFALTFGPARADEVRLGGNDVVLREGVDGATGVIFFDLNSPISTAAPIGMWSIYALQSGGQVQLLIFRPNSVTGTLDFVGGSPLETVTNLGVNAFTLPSPVNVKPGDLIAWYYPLGTLPSIAFSGAGATRNNHNWPWDPIPPDAWVPSTPNLLSEETNWYGPWDTNPRTYSIAVYTSCNHVVNGGFETGDLTGWTTNFTPPDFAVYILTEDGYGDDRVFEGTYSANFSGNEVVPGGVISQRVCTVPGVPYTLSWNSGAASWDDRAASLLVEVLGADGTTVLASKEVTHQGATPAFSDGSTPYYVDEPFTLTIVADGANATVRITDTTVNGVACDALLDNVQFHGPCCSENGPPTATDDYYGVNQATSLTVMSPGVMANDTDPDSDPLTAQLVTGPAHAASFVLNADGSFNYTPHAYFAGEDSFTYRVNDGTVSSEIATVRITVTQPGSQGFITGGGKFSQDGRKRTFGFVAKAKGSGAQGSLEFQDHDAGVNLKSDAVTWVYSPNPTTGYFSGTCSVSGVSGYTFFVQVRDLGEPGGNDELTIWVFDSLGNIVYAAGGPLSGGNIQIYGS